MTFNLAKLKDENVLISSTDEVFAGTDLANQGFTIEVKKLKRAEKIDLMSSALGEDGRISNGAYSRELFITSISDAEGFTDENQQPLTIENGVREIIWEYAPDLLVEEIKAKIQGFTATEEKKSEVPEHDLQTTQNGQ